MNTTQHDNEVRHPRDIQALSPLTHPLADRNDQHPAKAQDSGLFSAMAHPRRSGPERDRLSGPCLSAIGERPIGAHVPSGYIHLPSSMPLPVPPKVWLPSTGNVLHANSSQASQPIKPEPQRRSPQRLLSEVASSALPRRKQPTDRRNAACGQSSGHHRAQSPSKLRANIEVLDSRIHQRRTDNRGARRQSRELPSSTQALAPHARTHVDVTRGSERRTRVQRALDVLVSLLSKRSNIPRETRVRAARSLSITRKKKNYYQSTPTDVQYTRRYSMTHKPVNLFKRHDYDVAACLAPNTHWTMTTVQKLTSPRPAHQVVAEPGLPIEERPPANNTSCMAVLAPIELNVTGPAARHTRARLETRFLS